LNPSRDLLHRRRARFFTVTQPRSIQIFPDFPVQGNVGKADDQFARIPMQLFADARDFLENSLWCQ
jgi:hypothetical protein